VDEDGQISHPAVGLGPRGSLFLLVQVLNEAEGDCVSSLRRSKRLTRQGRMRRSQALHIVAERVGASDEVLDQLPDNWRPRPGLPAGGRDECRNGPRPCEYIWCIHHLWLRVGADRNGRRRGESVPATVMEMHKLTTCALDVAERSMSTAQLAELFGVSRRAIQLTIKRAL